MKVNYRKYIVACLIKQGRVNFPSSSKKFIVKFVKI